MPEPITAAQAIAQLYAQPTNDVAEVIPAIFDCSRSQAYRLATSGQVPVVRSGRRMRVISALLLQQLGYPAPAVGATTTGGVA
ncbi:hypothetical protein [Tsukamurella soli]|uniref:Helix-turn-helix domain-containing protein n=1 Tax=Tsukamurella soli TaxID=644556 RepID=A0ABP8J841_9ACTN